jgi:hypothetical protein
MSCDENRNRTGASGTDVRYLATKESLKASTADWGGKAIAGVDGRTHSAQFRELLSMVIDAGNQAIESTAKHVRTSAGPNSRVRLTDE